MSSVWEVYFTNGAISTSRNLQKSLFLATALFLDYLYRLLPISPLFNQSAVQVTMFVLLVPNTILALSC